MYTYPPTDSEHIGIFGRTVRQDPLPLFWTASGIEFTTDSAEAYIDLECDYDIHEYYLRVEIDGALIQRFMIPKGRGSCCLYRGFPHGQMRTVCVRMETQPMEEDAARKLLIHSVSTDTKLQPVMPHKHRIELIGDSLTSGEGLTGAQNITEWFAGIFGLTGHYGLKVVSHFDADYKIISKSGWGVYCGFDNNMKTRIPDHYTKVCGMLDSETGRSLGATKDWDFKAWQPELIIVNLCTNDGCATDSPPWTDPDTGISYKLAPIKDGTWEEESRNRFEDAVTAFLKLIRKNNPDAYILWAYGMCGPLMEPFITEAILTYKNETGDERVSYQPLKECPEEECGSHFHPGVTCHAQAADAIIRRVEELNIF